MRKEKFQTGEYYHIYNRGVDKREIFCDEKDFVRLLKSMREMNNNSSYEFRDYEKRKMSEKKLSFGYPKLSFIIVCLYQGGLITVIPAKAGIKNMSIKNLWSLNVDELLVASEIKQKFNKKDYEVFFPLNSQLKDIDLLLFNCNKNKSFNIQVKGSRTYEPSKSETNRYGYGKAAWFRINKNSIFLPKNKVDFYIFVLHSFSDTEIKKNISIDYLVVPSVELKNVCNKKVVRKRGFYHFFIWIDTREKRSFDFRDIKEAPISFTKYLNNWNLIR